MRHCLFLFFVFLFFSCKTKHRSTEEISVRSDAQSVISREAVEAHERTTQSISKLLAVDSVRVIISNYRPDGTLERTTDLRRWSHQTRADSIASVDSAMSNTSIKSRISAQEEMLSKRSVRVDTKPSLGIPWWLWIVSAIVVGVWVALTIIRRKRIW